MATSDAVRCPIPRHPASATSPRHGRSDAAVRCAGARHGERGRASVPRGFPTGPSSHGMPANLILVCGDAPVPPTWPETRIRSASAFATPAAIVPIPERATSLTGDRGLRIDLFQIVDQLREILDRVDVVMGRRRDQRDFRCACRSFAIFPVTLKPGSYPPSPGSAPCATLISIRGNRRDTPPSRRSRPDAICRSPSSHCRHWAAADSAPDLRRLRRNPLAPIRFTATSSVPWASGDARRRTCPA